MNKNLLLNDSLMFTTALIWGLAFVAQRVGMEFIGPFWFNGIRFALGALSLTVLIFILEWKKRHDSEVADCRKTDFRDKGKVEYIAGYKVHDKEEEKRNLILGGLLAGICLYLGSSFQQIGIVYTSAGNAGFVTSLYVVIVPFIGIFFGHTQTRGRWIAAMFAIIGLYLLSVTEGFRIRIGDGLVLVSALFWALHMLTIAHFSPKSDTLKLSIIQFTVCSVFSIIAGFFLEEISFEAVKLAALPLAYGGFMSVGIAYTLQVIAQKKAHPAHAAIILSLEGAFAAIGGWVIIGEIMTFRGITGCAFLLLGVFTAQWETIFSAHVKKRITTKNLHMKKKRKEI